MSADGSPSSAGPDYRKLAVEVRALIASGAFHAPESIEDLQRLADRYDALADDGLKRAVADQVNRCG